MILDSIVSQHAEEAAFLWLLRDDAVTAPHFTLTDLADLESRIEAHLDGLRVAGEAGWEHCLEQLKLSETGEVFTAGFMALDSSLDEGLERVLEVIEEAPATARGLVSALGWVDKDKLQGHVVGWLQSEVPLLRRIGLSACAIQRVDCGAYLTRGVDDTDSGVRARALRSIGEIHRGDLGRSLREHLEDEDEACRFWSAWSAAMLDDVVGTERLLSFAEENSPFQQPALELLMRKLEKSASVECLRGLSNSQPSSRAVVQASGYFGDPASVPWLIEKMKTAELSRVAGEAFRQITGIDLAYHDLDAEPPEGFSAGPTENPQDEEVDMDRDEELSWPDSAAIAAWWGEHQSGYPTGERLLCGAPVDRNQCMRILRSGFQRQRRAAAMELALIDANGPLFNTSAIAKLQTTLIG